MTTSLKKRYYSLTKEMFKVFSKDIAKSLVSLYSLPNEVTASLAVCTLIYNDNKFNFFISDYIEELHSITERANRLLDFLNNKLLNKLSEFYQEKPFFIKDLPIPFCLGDQLNETSLERGVSYHAFKAKVSNCFDLECVKRFYKKVIYDSPIFMFNKETKAISYSMEANKPLFPDPYILSEEYQYTIDEIAKANVAHPWENKFDKAFWRGSITTALSLNRLWIQNDYFNNYTQEERDLAFPRLSLVILSQFYPNYIDALFSNETSIDWLEKYFLNSWKKLIPHLDLKDISKKEYVKIFDTIQYKYLISVDGMGSAWGRVPWILKSNSVLLKHKSNKVQWFYNDLKEGVHYKEIPLNLFDDGLLKLVDYLRVHDDEAKQIADNGTKFFNAHFSLESLIETSYTILSDYYEMFDSEAINEVINIFDIYKNNELKRKYSFVRMDEYLLKYGIRSQDELKDMSVEDKKNTIKVELCKIEKNDSQCMTQDYYTNKLDIYLDKLRLSRFNLEIDVEKMDEYLLKYGIRSQDELKDMSVEDKKNTIKVELCKNAKEGYDSCVSNIVPELYIKTIYNNNPFINNEDNTYDI